MYTVIVKYKAAKRSKARTAERKLISAHDDYNQNRLLSASYVPSAVLVGFQALKSFKTTL